MRERVLRMVRTADRITHEINALNVRPESYGAAQALLDSVQPTVHEQQQKLDERSEHYVQRADARRQLLLQSLSFYQHAVAAFEKLDGIEAQLQSLTGGAPLSPPTPSGQSHAAMEDTLIRLQRAAEECAVSAIRDGRLLLDRAGTGSGTEGVQQCVCPCG